MSSDKPLISIIIPVRDGSKYLARAIDSALAQTYANFEALVINDGSDDGGKTDAIARSYGRQLRYFTKPNGGVASALNMGIREMRGDYFSWLSHDDEYYPRKLERQAAFLPKLRGPAAVYCDFEVISAKGIPLRHVRGLGVLRRHLPYYLCLGMPIHGNTMLIPRKFFDEFGLFDEKLPTTQDYALWFKMALAGKIEYLPETLVKTRLHKTQGSAHKSHLKESDEMAAGFLSRLESDRLPKVEKAELLLAITNSLRRKRLKLAHKLAYAMFKKLSPGPFSEARYRMSALLDPIHHVRQGVKAAVRKIF